MFTDDGIFVFLNVKVEVTVRVAYIIRTTQTTFKFILNALLVYQEGFVSVTFKSSEIFLLVKTSCCTLSISFERRLGVGGFLVFERQRDSYRAVD